jgi:DNA repair protein RecO (recombination protein O)
MALTRCEAVVVRTYPLGDTSRIAVLYSREFGLVRGVAKGARGPKSRFGAGLEPLSVVDVVLYRKDGRDLDLLSKIDVIKDWRASDLARVAHAQAVLEFVDRLVHEVEPDARLYDLVRRALEALAVVPSAALPSVTLAFQIHASALLGYALECARCAGCGEPPAGRFAPARGGAVCARCAEGEGQVAFASPAALQGLATLAATTSPDALVSTEGALPHAGEMLRLVEFHLRSHVARFSGFRSLAFLFALEGAAA